MNYTVTSWNSDDGDIDAVVSTSPEVLYPGQSSIWPDGLQMTQLCSTADTDDPEGNARLILAALERTTQEDEKIATGMRLMAEMSPTIGEVIETWRRRAVAAERELEAMRLLAANPLAIQKVKDELGPLSLWSAEGLKRHDAGIISSYQRDARRYRWLRDLKCNSVTVGHDDENACNYMTAKEWIESGMDPQEFADVPADVLQRMKNDNSIWAIQIYPDTPIGFVKFYGESLDTAIDAAMNDVATP